MQIDKASEKSIRITAMDTEDQGVKVFLISVQHQVFLMLRSSSYRHHRILALRSRARQEVETKPAPPEPGMLQSSEEDSDEDAAPMYSTALASEVRLYKVSLRLILNTKLWAQMQIDKASEKSIRITAMDTEDQGVKVFLISIVALHHRILALRSRARQEVETKPAPPEPGMLQSSEEDSDEDAAPMHSTALASGNHPPRPAQYQYHFVIVLYEGMV
ncbi:hypothetical protein AAFF_G00251080 [Aldrovandia affinis]|uniref:Uncharacterized protein n=1 Tax=Aldrovandia affinis TaxID=143900 RepID=A0AAD7RFE4_9TELE|nr:hypothetical protein AAFF_G00251080 [Aldrovandia affinis]